VGGATRARCEASGRGWGCGWETSSRRRTATSADSPLRDGSPYRGLHVRCERIGGAHNSVEDGCRSFRTFGPSSSFAPCQTLAVRFATCLVESWTREPEWDFGEEIAGTRGRAPMQLQGLHTSTTASSFPPARDYQRNILSLSPGKGLHHQRGSQRSSLSPGKRLHHQRSSSSHDATPHPG
jgi:hypothetical protein